MTTLDYLSSVLEMNAEVLTSSPGDYRHAVNAILSADAFFGIYWAEKNSAFNDDTALRDHIAAQCEAYKLLRDMAFSLKHGQLTGKRPRLVSNANAAALRTANWTDAGTWDDGLPWTDELVFVIFNRTDPPVRVDVLVNAVVEIARALVAGGPLPSVSLASLCRVLN